MRWQIDLELWSWMQLYWDLNKFVFSLPLYTSDIFTLTDNFKINWHVLKIRLLTKYFFKFAATSTDNLWMQTMWDLSRGITLKVRITDYGIQEWWFVKFEPIKSNKCVGITTPQIVSPSTVSEIHPQSKTSAPSETIKKSISTWPVEGTPQDPSPSSNLADFRVYFRHAANIIPGKTWETHWRYPCTGVGWCPEIVLESSSLPSGAKPWSA